MAYELTAFLDYEKYARSDNANCRNGSYSRKIDTKFGSITVKIPRDRLGEFYTSFLPKYKRRDESTEATILSLFEKGLTNSEIAAMIQELCGVKYSRQTISNITDHVIESIDAFKNRTLNDEYAVIYLDGTAMAMRRDTVSKEMVHIALGVRTDGTKEILGYLIAPTESALAPKTFGTTALQKYLSMSSRAKQYMEDQWLSEANLTRAYLNSLICKKEHPQSKYIYMPSEECTKKRSINTDIGFLICSTSTLMWSPFSPACQICTNVEKCKQETAIKYPELYRIRLEEYGERR